jgi:hypothetical protein
MQSSNPNCCSKYCGSCHVIITHIELMNVGVPISIVQKSYSISNRCSEGDECEIVYITEGSYVYLIALGPIN